jgi:hypothetical protein
MGGSSSKIEELEENISNGRIDIKALSEKLEKKDKEVFL